MIFFISFLLSCFCIVYVKKVEVKLSYKLVDVDWYWNWKPQRKLEACKLKYIQASDDCLLFFLPFQSIFLCLSNMYTNHNLTKSTISSFHCVISSIRIFMHTCEEIWSVICWFLSSLFSVNFNSFIQSFIQWPKSSMKWRKIPGILIKS